MNMLEDKLKELNIFFFEYQIEKKFIKNKNGNAQSVSEFMTIINILNENHINYKVVDNMSIQLL